MKSRDTFAPIGPYLVTADEIPDPQKLQIRLWNNGTLMQNFNTDDMAHKIPRCIEWLTSIHTLEPGDILATGTNHRGLNPFMDGDKIELEIEGLGRLTFNIKDELKRTWERETRLQMPRRGGAEDTRRLPRHHAAADWQIRQGELTRRAPLAIGERRSLITEGSIGRIAPRLSALCCCARYPIGRGRSPATVLMNLRRWGTGLHDDLADHHRMQRAVISELARLREGVGKPIAGIQRRGTENFPFSVTVCGNSSSFTHVTVVPGAIVRTDGLNSYPSMTNSRAPRLWSPDRRRMRSRLPRQTAIATNRGLYIGPAP